MAGCFQSLVMKWMNDFSQNGVQFWSGSSPPAGFLKDAFFCLLPAESQKQSFLSRRGFMKLHLLTGAQRQEKGRGGNDLKASKYRNFVRRCQEREVDFSSFFSADFFKWRNNSSKREQKHQHWKLLKHPQHQQSYLQCDHKENMI